MTPGALAGEARVAGTFVCPRSSHGAGGVDVTPALIREMTIVDCTAGSTVAFVSRITGAQFAARTGHMTGRIQVTPAILSKARVYSSASS